MKRVLMVATGGTIASKPTPDGLAPQMSADELLGMVPQIGLQCEVSAVQLINIDSTNMSPDCWLRISECIRIHYAAYDGFVITHGTDTMAYTAAALTYLMQGIGKPVMLTGSQRSIWLRDTDARQNLTDAFCAAADGALPDVYIVFDGKVICGTRARKMRTKSMNAFSSIDWPEAALVREGRLLHILQTPERGKVPRFADRLNSKVFVLRLIPGMDPGILPELARRYDALVIESFGVGGLPCYEQEDFLAALDVWRKAGKPVVISTQVPHEGSDLGVYEVGNRAARLPGVLQAYTMTLEAVVTKLMWILGFEKDPERIRKLFYTPVAYDLLRFEEPAE